MSKPTKLEAIGRAVDILTALQEAGEEFFAGKEQPFWFEDGHKDNEALEVLKNMLETAA